MNELLSRDSSSPHSSVSQILNEEKTAPRASRKMSIQIFDNYKDNISDRKFSVPVSLEEEKPEESLKKEVSRSVSSSPSEESNEPLYPKIDEKGTPKTTPYKSRGLRQPKPSKAKKLQFLEETISDPELVIDEEGRKRGSNSKTPTTPFLLDRSHEDLSKFAQQMEFIVSMTVESMKRKIEDLAHNYITQVANSQKSGHSSSRPKSAEPLDREEDK